jgi:hypothetical protein
MKILPAVALILVGVPAMANSHVIFVVDKVQTVGKSNASNNGIFGTSASSTTMEAHTAPGVTAALIQRCPANLSITQDQSGAEWLLQTQFGATMIVDKKGTVLYVSPAKTMRNMTKDVCAFISSH